MHDPNQQISWLQPEAPAQPQYDPQQQQQQYYQQPQTEPLKSGHRVIKLVFFVINMGFMVMVSAAGALGMAEFAVTTASFFVGLYMLVFASILGLYELIQLCPIASVDGFYKRNFGFLYGMNGKCLFIIFMGIFCGGLVTNVSATTPSSSTSSSSSSDSTSTTGTGSNSSSSNLDLQTVSQQLAFSCCILVSLWGVIQLAVAYKFPDYFDKKEKFVP